MSQHVQDVGKAMDILSDILLHSELTVGSVTRERGVIVREMEEVSRQVFRSRRKEKEMDMEKENCGSSSDGSRSLLLP